MAQQGQQVVLRDRKILRLDTALAWAVQIDPALLGASLQAYFAIRPQLLILNCCHRYGVSPGGRPAAITRLPAEIINDIEGIATGMMRGKCSVFWEHLLVCASQENCTAYGLNVAHDLFHLGDKEVAKQINQFSQYFCRKCTSRKRCNLCVRLIAFDLSAVDEDDMYRGRVQEWISNVSSNVAANHRFLEEFWKDRILRGLPYTATGEQILHRCFGLKSWAALLRGFSKTDPEAEHTVVYLVPSDTVTYTTRCERIKEDDDDDFQNHMRLHLGVPFKGVIDPVITRQFGRAMRILRLEPTVGRYTFLQRGLSDMVGEGQALFPDVGLVPERWPSLMALSRASYIEEEPDDQGDEDYIHF